MRGDKQKKSAASFWKPVFVITGGCVVLFLIIFGFLYYTNKPNYRDLENEYNKLSIPSDWKQKNIDRVGNTLGGFICIELDKTCPQIHSVYYHNITNKIEAIKVAEKILNYSIYIKDCKLSQDYKNIEYCNFTHQKNDIKITISFTFNLERQPNKPNESAINIEKIK